MKFLAVSFIALLFTGQAIAKPAEGCLKNYTITDTDNCVSVATRFQLLDADFYKMNPGLHHSAAHDCDNLDVGKPFCVCMEQPCSSGVTVGAVAANAAINSSNAPSISLSASGIPSFPQIAPAAATASSPSSKESGVAKSTQTQSSTTSGAGSTTTIFGVVAIGMAFAATSLLL